MQIKIAQFHYSRLCRMILATIFTILLSIPITAPNVSALPNTAIKPMVAVGNNHTLILRGDGTVWAVGRNDFGQLGDGTRIDKLSPVQVEGLTDVVWIAARGWVSFAVKSDGTIWAWGSNQEGQLGISGTNSSPTPVKNPNITDVREVKTNGSFVLALKKDASLWAWGQNQFGQLGNGTPNEEPNPYPIQVQGMKNIKTFETAIDAALAVKSDGTVWAWGRNDSGQLGIGSTVDQHSPIQVESLVDVVQFATGWFYTLALKSDGTVWSFGLNNGDQLGIKTEEKNSTSPKPITGLNNIVSISAGEEFGMALDGNGQLWGWGERLMPGDQLSKYMPKNIMSNVSGIISNLHSKIAMKEDGSVLAWGFNDGNLT